MPYIVKSSLDIGGKIVPWNERETQKLIKDKEQFLKEKEKENVAKIQEKDVAKIELVDQVPEGEEVLDRVDIVENVEDVEDVEDNKSKKSLGKKK